LSPRQESLSSVDPLTPAQIRVVATRLLLHDDMKIRSQASSKLLSAGSAAVPVLKDIAVSSSDPKLRLTVLALLTSLDPAGSVGILERMIADPDVEVRGGALRAAAQLGGSQAVPILERRLKDPDPDIRAAAALFGGVESHGWTTTSLWYGPES